jgi:23S rRNA (uridine2552-2'-O)-methyltransferase
VSRPRRSSGSWHERQERDPWVRKARSQGWRSRSVFKLAEIAEKERLLRPGMLVVDLGAAPGGWSQYVEERLEGRVRIVAVDLLPMEPLPSVEFIQGDFTEEAVLDELVRRVGEAGADLVMSDMAPNISGNRAVDQPRCMYLAELALDAARRLLKPGGSFLCKVFQGEGTEAFVAEARRAFERVRIVKPRASRPASREVYVAALGLRSPG